MTIVIARLWYKPGSRTISADFLQKRLIGNLGCTVTQIAGIAGTVPLLQVSAPVDVRICLKNDDNITTQAADFADSIQKMGGDVPAVAKLRGATRVLEFHADPAIDPQTDPVKGILTGLTSGLDGVLEDLIHGRLVMAPPRKTSFLGRMFAR